MKKTTLFFTLIVIFTGLQGIAQDFQNQLNQAQSSYNSGDLENARFQLQEALNSINQEIGREILALLPENMGEMNKVAAEDNVTGTNMGFAGLYVNRNYKAESSDASVEIISDSPMMAGINSLLTMPVFINSDPNQKRIKVKNYKALLNKSEDTTTGITSYTIQMPFGSSMLTFKTNGIGDEKEVTGLMSSLPVEDIVKLAQ